jgi:hypothetical protein
VKSLLFMKDNFSSTRVLKKHTPSP